MVKKEAFGISIDMWVNHCSYYSGSGRMHGGAVSGITCMRDGSYGWALYPHVGQHRSKLRWREKSWEMETLSREYEHPGRYRPLDRGK
jgi:hypothetical protein